MIRRFRFLHLVIIAILLLLGAGSATAATRLGILWPASSPRTLTATITPTSAPTLAPTVLVISHEGGRRVAIARVVLRQGAGAVEIDVVAHHGVLYVSHHPVGADDVPSVPTVQQVWPVDATARIVELDLKQSSPQFQRVLVAFLTAHSGPGSPQIFVSSRSVSNLRAVKVGAPTVFRFLSIGDISQWTALQSNPTTISLIDGVSIWQNLLTRANVTWLHQHGLLVYAWTVDNSARVQTLLRWGVDGITTNQPGIVTMLARMEHGDPYRLQRLMHQA